MLIQAYERRVLTYNPANPPAFQVEMGNIGLHYYDWRYNNAGACPRRHRAPPPAASPPQASTRRSAAARRSPPAPPSPTHHPADRHPDRQHPRGPLTGKIAWVSNARRQESQSGS